MDGEKAYRFPRIHKITSGVLYTLNTNNNINDDKKKKRLKVIISLCFSSLSFISIIIFFFFYSISQKYSTKNAGKTTLMFDVNMYMCVYQCALRKNCETEKQKALENLSKPMQESNRRKKINQ